MNLILTTLLLGNLIVTSYRSVPAQCDDTPFHTSIGERVHPHGVAVSQDFLKRNKGPLDYGDTVYIEGIGFRVVNDCMNIRHKHRMDIWLETYEQEKEFDNKFGHKKLRVWLIKRSR